MNSIFTLLHGLIKGSQYFFPKTIFIICQIKTGTILLTALGNLFLVEGSGRGDCAKERGDPCTERLPERGTTGERGPTAGPDAAGDSETERAERH